MKSAFWHVWIGAALQLTGQSVLAQVFFEQPREFVLDQTCDAYASLKKKNNPETLAMGETYTALGENKQPNA